MDKITIPRKEHLGRKKFVISKFQCIKCNKEHKWDSKTELLETDCNCGWVHLRAIEGDWIPV